MSDVLYSLRKASITIAVGVIGTKRMSILGGVLDTDTVIATGW
jgi:hypothetical protein